jgi:DNA-binding beta-propeller fold protein YncE
MKPSPRRPLLALVIALGVLAIAGSPARAAILYRPLGLTFGAFAKPTGVSVDQSNGNVYVSDSGASTVDVFGAEGEAPVGGVVTPITGAPASFDFGENPAQSAIDESSSSSKDDLYVTDPGHNVVDKFKQNASAEYEYVCQFTGYGRGCEPEPVEEPTWVAPRGVTVDSQGNVYITSIGPGAGAVYEFNAAAENVRQISGGQIVLPGGVAVSADGTVYIHDLNPQAIVKITPANSESVLYSGSASGEKPERPTAVAVDADENVFVDASESIIEFNKSGEQIDQFGQGLIGSEGAASCFERPCSEGVAVYDLNRDVYVTNRETNQVVVFAPKDLPVPETGSAGNVAKTTATVAGAVNPSGEEAHYFFEYAADEEYAATKEYGLTTPKLVAEAGSTSVSVQASLSELAPGTTYHYRLVAENSNGANPGEDRTFTTAPAVTFKACPPLNLLGTSATLCARIDPEGLETTYAFVYGLEAKPAEEWFEYGAFTNFESTGTGEGEATFTAPATGLLPATTYHYRFMAFNEINGFSRTIGADETFTTPPAEPTVNAGSPFATGIAPHEATLHGTINPGNGLTSYHFVYGPTSAYGSSSSAAYTQVNYEDDPVAQLITGLQANTVYHYALVAENSSGTTTGSDATFTTVPANAPAPAQPGPSAPSFGVSGDLGIVQPATPPLIAFTPVAFSAEAGHASPPARLTNAQKLAKALKACRRDRRRAKRARCERQARRHYAKGAR